MKYSCDSKIRDLLEEKRKIDQSIKKREWEIEKEVTLNLNICIGCKLLFTENKMYQENGFIVEVCPISSCLKGHTKCCGKIVIGYSKPIIETRAIFKT